LKVGGGGEGTYDLLSEEAPSWFGGDEAKFFLKITASRLA